MPQSEEYASHGWCDDAPPPADLRQGHELALLKLRLGRKLYLATHETSSASTKRKSVPLPTSARSRSSGGDNDERPVTRDISTVSAVAVALSTPKKKPSSEQGSRIPRFNATAVERRPSVDVVMPAALTIGDMNSSIQVRRTKSLSRPTKQSSQLPVSRRNGEPQATAPWSTDDQDNIQVQAFTTTTASAAETQNGMHTSLPPDDSRDNHSLTRQPSLLDKTPPLPIATSADDATVTAGMHGDVEQAPERATSLQPYTESTVSAAVAGPQVFATRKSFQKLVVKWTCSTCDRECIPVRDESRCLWYVTRPCHPPLMGQCSGHRLKEHPATAADPRVKGDKGKFKAFACTTARCPCRAFFYIVAEGAWVLRCRCKHKHINHDASAAPFRCKIPRCDCDGFDSPWVCNCAHPWADHVQSQVIKTFHPLVDPLDLGAELGQVARTDLLATPLVLS
ncbi:Aste57867_10201 [Aphanomyces stellatus]|uniref:Protein FAM221A n=1 Tax=Aphanomyces stellatus TaxID=120398 RepID=A0A485KQ93_9STRA|nr:hypothetical protein As57867_010162 [Aphanomyces stellatus]VFT87077.1 Aste57867_10201 [Aphanomyces stellatus]